MLIEVPELTHATRSWPLWESGPEGSPSNSQLKEKDCGLELAAC